MLYAHALASNRTVPSGSVAAGPSVLAYCSPPTVGITGPAAHEPIVPALYRYTPVCAGVFVVHGSGYSSVLVPAPTTNTFPPGSSACGPISTTGHGLRGKPLGASAPEKVHVLLSGLNSCEPPTAAHTSTVRTW